MRGLEGKGEARRASERASERGTNRHAPFCFSSASASPLSFARCRVFPLFVLLSPSFFSLVSDLLGSPDPEHLSLLEPEERRIDG